MHIIIIIEIMVGQIEIENIIHAYHINLKIFFFFFPFMSNELLLYEKLLFYIYKYINYIFVYILR